MLTFVEFVSRVMEKYMSLTNIQLVRIGVADATLNHLEVINSLDYHFSQNEYEAIMRALQRGNTVEIKKERDRLVIVEIERKVKTKTSITG